MLLLWENFPQISISEKVSLGVSEDGGGREGAGERATDPG